MRKHLGKLILFAVVLALSASSMFASVPVACPATTTFDHLLGYTNVDNACYSQDKLFYGFTYTAINGTAVGTPAIGVSANIIADPNPGFDIHGWNFGDNWFGSGFTLSYTIQVCTVAPCTITPGVYIYAADAAYATTSQATPGTETVTWSNSGGTLATQTLTSGTPGPLPATGNIGYSGTGPITVTAQLIAPGNITQTTLRFYEMTAVPEPSSILLLGVFGVFGVVALGLSRRRIFTA